MSSSQCDPRLVDVVLNLHSGPLRPRVWNPSARCALCNAVTTGVTKACIAGRPCIGLPRSGYGFASYKVRNCGLAQTIKVGKVGNLREFTEIPRTFLEVRGSREVMLHHCTNPLKPTQALTGMPAHVRMLTYTHAHAQSVDPCAFPQEEPLSLNAAQHDPLVTGPPNLTTRFHMRTRKQSHEQMQ